MSNLSKVARRVAAGTASNAAGRVAVLASKIVVTPVIVHAVGVTDYGIWILIATVASFGSILELGISAGLVKYVAEHSAREETDDAARIVGAATWLYRVLGLSIAFVAGLIALGAPLVLGLEGESATLARELGLLAALDLGFSMLPLAPLSVLKGLQRFPAVNAIQAGIAVLSVVLVVIAIAVGGGIVTVSAVFTFSTALTAAISRFVARRAVPRYFSASARRDPEQVRRLVRFSRSVAVVQIAANLQGRFDAVIVTAALPVRNVTPYSFAQRLSDGTRTATDQFGRVLFPLASEINATRDPSAVRELFLTSTRLTLAIALAVGLPVALLGGPILEVWVGDQFAGYGTVVAILTCAAIVDLPSYPAAAVLQSVERHGPFAWMATISAIANVGLSIALVGPYGLEGIATGTLVASSVEIIVFVLPYAARVLGVSLWDFLSAVVVPLAGPAAVMAVLVIAGQALLPVTSLLRLIVVVSGSLAGYTIVYGMFGAAPRERELYRSALSALVRRGRK